MKLRDCKPGTRVITGLSKFGNHRSLDDRESVGEIESTLILMSVDGVLLGWEIKPAVPAWDKQTTDREVRELMLKYKCNFGYWVDNYTCRFAVNVPGQKCEACGISLAHKEFVAGSKVICVPCKVYGEL
jgi:hypothetical protein